MDNTDKPVVPKRPAIPQQRSATEAQTSTQPEKTTVSKPGAPIRPPKPKITPESSDSSSPGPPKLVPRRSTENIINNSDTTNSSSPRTLPILVPRKLDPPVNNEDQAPKTPTTPNQPLLNIQQTSNPPTAVIKKEEQPPPLPPQPQLNKKPAIVPRKIPVALDENLILANTNEPEPPRPITPKRPLLPLSPSVPERPERPSTPDRGLNSPTIPEKSTNLFSNKNTPEVAPLKSKPVTSSSFSKKTTNSQPLPDKTNSVLVNTTGSSFNSDYSSSNYNSSNYGSGNYDFTDKKIETAAAMKSVLTVHTINNDDKSTTTAAAPKSPKKEIISSLSAFSMSKQASDPDLKQNEPSLKIDKPPLVPKSENEPDKHDQQKKKDLANLFILHRKIKILELVRFQEEEQMILKILFLTILIILKFGYQVLPLL